MSAGVFDWNSSISPMSLTIGGERDNPSSLISCLSLPSPMLWLNCSSMCHGRFEVYELFRRLVQTGLIIFIAPGTVTQVAVGFVFANVAVIIHLQTAPCESFPIDADAVAACLSLIHPSPH